MLLPRGLRKTSEKNVALVCLRGGYPAVHGQKYGTVPSIGGGVGKTLEKNVALVWLCGGLSFHGATVLTPDFCPKTSPIYTSGVVEFGLPPTFAAIGHLRLGYDHTFSS